MVDEKDLLKAYLKLFFSKWYSCFFSSLNILGAILLFFAPSENVLIVIVLTISFIGIIASGYKVYRDLFHNIPENQRLAYLPPKIGKPEIEIYQIGGKEYSFGFIGKMKSFTTSSQLLPSIDSKEVLPKAAVDFYFVVKNIGYIPAKILAIKGNIDIRKPLHFMTPESLNIDLDPIRYPIKLDNPGDEKEIILQVLIFPSSLVTQAQVANMIGNYLSSVKEEKIIVSVEIADIDNKSISIEKEFSFTTEILYKIYIEHWRSLGASDLVELSCK